MCVKSFSFVCFLKKLSFTIQLLQLSDAMRPEDDSCLDNVKEMSPRSKLYHFKVEIKKKLTYHPDWYSNLFLNAYINRHVHSEYLKGLTL